ncbi:MAG: GNAT family N-acetyltransferase [Longimicrobiaceae bacterium]
MELVRHPDAESFLRDAQADLERAEAENNMVLGGALRLVGRPQAPERPRYFATVRAGGGLRAAAMHTPPFALALVGDGAGEALERVVEDLRAAGVRPGGVFGPVALADGFAAVWTRAVGEAARVAMRERLFALTEVLPVRPAPGALRRAAAADEDTVARWMTAFDAEALGEADAERARAAARRRIAAGEMWIWEVEGEPRSMAASDRPTRHGVAVNAVYTPPEWRGRGYATVAVARLSAGLLAQGRRFCVLFTDLANPVSNAIYQRIGYRPRADFTLYHLGG